MTFDINSIFPELEALTPDGRWNALQDWLSKNSEYGKSVDRWASQTREQVFEEICVVVSRKYGTAGVLVANVMKPKIMRAIETLQACYRERVGQTEKEIKNVRTTKDAGRRSTKDHRRTNARAKRTDQA